MRFVDFRTSERCPGQVVAKHATRTSVLEDAVRRTWKFPYVSIEAAKTTPGDTAKPYNPPLEPARPASPTGGDLLLEFSSQQFEPRRGGD